MPFFGTTLGGQFDSALPMDLSIDLNHRLSFTSIDLSTSGTGPQNRDLG